MNTNVGTRLEVDVSEDQKTVNIVPPAEWPNLTVNQLFEQKSIMLNRWIFLVENNYPYATEIKKALDAIDALIAEK